MKTYLNLQTAVLIILLYRFLQFSFTLIPPQILLKTFLSKAASRLPTSSFNVQDLLRTLPLVYNMKVTRNKYLTSHIEVIREEPLGLGLWFL
jgi:hypothetical protein